MQLTPGLPLLCPDVRWGAMLRIDSSMPEQCTHMQPFLSCSTNFRHVPDTRMLAAAKAAASVLSCLICCSPWMQTHSQGTDIIPANDTTAWQRLYSPCFRTWHDHTWGSTVTALVSGTVRARVDESALMHRQGAGPPRLCPGSRRVME